MAIHIKDVTIDAYRGFEDFHIADLNHVNIFLGNNNAGKTSILEVIRSVKDPANIRNWLNLSRWDMNDASSFFNDFLNLFPADDMQLNMGYHFTDASGKNRSVEVKGDIEETQIAESEMNRINGYIRTGSKAKGVQEQMLDTRCLKLCFYIDQEEKRRDLIYDRQRRYSARVSLRKEMINTVYVSPVSFVLNNSFFSKVLEQNEMNAKLVEVLKIYDGSVQGIQAIEGVYGVEYKILSSQHRSAMPLETFGDGMKKALLLVSAVIAASDGILLIDEFEGSIHTSAMQQTFQWVLDVAKEMNVQIFMTTHSEEALRKILEVKRNFKKDEMKVYTLFNEDGIHRIRGLLREEAVKAMEVWRMELR